MAEILLLPQWAESLQERRVRPFRVLSEWFTTFADSIRTACLAIADTIREAVQPLLDVFQSAFYPPKKHPKPCKRSSRRLKVQQKRKRIGLSVDGKLTPFTYTAPCLSLKTGQWSLDVRLYVPTRKESLHAAMQAERIMKTHPTWIREDEAAHLQGLAHTWMRYQMNVRWT